MYADFNKLYKGHPRRQIIRVNWPPSVVKITTIVIIINVNLNGDIVFDVDVVNPFTPEEFTIDE